jgi:hypothetical protein
MKWRRREVMPIHLSTVDKLGVLARHLQIKLNPGGADPRLRDFSLARRLEALLAGRKDQRIVTITSYGSWVNTFGRAPEYVSASAYQNEFRAGGDLDWVVKQAFAKNPGMRIELIFFDADRDSLKRVEAVTGGTSSILWTA